MSEAWRASFVVRLVRDSRGQVSGVIERVATGAKEAFQGVEAIGPVIARMVDAWFGDDRSRNGPGTQPDHRPDRNERDRDEGAGGTPAAQTGS